MEIVFRCATCRTGLVAARADAARHVRCATCGSPARVPGPPALRGLLDGVSVCPTCGHRTQPGARKCGRPGCGEYLDPAFLARRAARDLLTAHLAPVAPVASSAPSGRWLAQLALALSLMPCLGVTAIAALFVARAARRRIAAGGEGSAPVAIAAMVFAILQVVLWTLTYAAIAAAP